MHWENQGGHLYESSALHIIPLKQSMLNVFMHFLFMQFIRPQFSSIRTKTIAKSSIFVFCWIL